MRCSFCDRAEAIATSANGRVGVCKTCAAPSGPLDKLRSDAAAPGKPMTAGAQLSAGRGKPPQRRMTQAEVQRTLARADAHARGEVTKEQAAEMARAAGFSTHAVAGELGGASAVATPPRPARPGETAARRAAREEARQLAAKAGFATY